MAANPLLTQPIFFEPLYMERVWGGRRLAQLYHKQIPLTGRIGESWEIVDREDSQSVVHEGPLRSKTLHELWKNPESRNAIFGPGWENVPRFPLLFKILDAQDRISLQVHPPTAVAARFSTESKTELWYFAAVENGAEIYAGLAKEGITKQEFEEALHGGYAADLIHRIPTKTGDAMFIPSGRVHAIGAGNLIIEIQQNSDTTYRVFDWDRLGLDGLPRPLHVAESLLSIQFEDVCPGLQPPVDVHQGGTIAECEFFRVEKWILSQEQAVPRFALEDTQGQCAIFTLLTGEVECGGLCFQAGSFFLVPACLPEMTIRAKSEEASLLRTLLPKPPR